MAAAGSGGADSGRRDRDWRRSYVPPRALRVWGDRDLRRSCAKAVLMRHQGLSEDAAYRLMRQTAMNQGRRLPDVARAVLELEAFLPGVASAG